MLSIPLTIMQLSAFLDARPRPAAPERDEASFSAQEIASLLTSAFQTIAESARA